MHGIRTTRKGAARCAPTKKLLLILITITLLLIFALPTAAQEVTDDQVNEIAEKLYCPVCENIPLDACGTAACAQWRDEIRAQLAEGMTEQQVIDNFVSRFGEHVVGTPVDPTLRALSLITPWVIGALAVLVAVWTLLRWRMGPSVTQRTTTPTENSIRDDDYYRARIEQDLQSRR